MKDKKTLKELFAEARRAKYDSFGIASDPDLLDAIKTVAERRGDLETAKEIGEQVEKLRGLHTKERILEILEKDNVYYRTNRLSISALYDWKDIKVDLTNLIDKKERKKPIPCEWAICRETDEIDDIDLYDADRPFTLHIPIEHFDDVEEAVNRFNFLYCLESRGIDTSNRCGDCKWFLDNGVCDLHDDLWNKKDIGCEEYEYKSKEEEA